MVNEYESLKEVIERGNKLSMPRDARLIILGRIINAAGRDELSTPQAYELEDMLGLGTRENYEEILSYALMGTQDSSDGN